MDHPITPQHLALKAIIYVRQSTTKQMRDNKGSTAYQRAQKEHALRWGWKEENIEIIDDDLGLSGTSTRRRGGFKRLQQLVAGEQVGRILVSGLDRLTRSVADCRDLLRLFQATGTLLFVNGVPVDLDDLVGALSKGEPTGQ